MNTKWDVIVVGSGIAGLSFALKVVKQGFRVAVITKKAQTDSNTNYAQGGVACVMQEGDSFDLHVKDTMVAGDGLCDPEAIEKVVSEGPGRIRELIEMGVTFSRKADGSHDLGQEGGHSARRILHAKDMTGQVIESALVNTIEASPNIDVYEHVFAVDLITSRKVGMHGEDRILGLYVFDTESGSVHTLEASAVMLATGGVGQLYPYTTNPSIATGDGIAMAFRAGAQVRNMEFVQFHPTALYTHAGDRFLISEAVRGEGAILYNTENEPFMERYDDRAELAPRDIVARAIDSEMKRLGARHVWLDMRHLGKARIEERFPKIYARALKEGLDPASEPLPVVPAAHYLCGGIRTNMSAETNIAGLFACGEVACTGLHGANRLASNSLLEAVVMADAGAEAACLYMNHPRPEADPLPDWVDGDVSDSDERVVLLHNSDELKRTLWDYVGIVRTTKRLLRAKRRIEQLSQEVEEYYWNFKVEPQLLELRNMIQVAALIVECALKRKESRGLHYTLDYPEKEAHLLNTSAEPASV